MLGRQALHQQQVWGKRPNNCKNIRVVKILFNIRVVNVLIKLELLKL